MRVVEVQRKMKHISTILLVFAILLGETRSSRLRSDPPPADRGKVCSAYTTCTDCMYVSKCAWCLPGSVCERSCPLVKDKKTLYVGAPSPSDWKCKELEESDTRSKMIQRAIDDSAGSLNKRAFDPFTGLNPLVKSLGWGSRQ